MNRTIKRIWLLISLRYKLLSLCSLFGVMCFLFGLIPIVRSFYIKLSQFLISVFSLFMGKPLEDKLLILASLITAGWALFQWYNSRREKRAEMLGNEHHRIWDRCIESYNDVVENATGEVKSSTKVLQFLIDLSYVAYLRNRGIIQQSEMSPFDNMFFKVFRETSYLDVLINYPNPKTAPMYELIKYAVKYDDRHIAYFMVDYLLDGRLEQRKKDAYINEIATRKAKRAKELVLPGNDTILYGARFSTHVDILNNVFGLDVNFHMRGAQRLRNGALVWFPRLVHKHTGELDIWHNVLAEDGKTLREYWPKSKSEREPRREHNRDEVRLVFAYDMDSNEDERYKFIGVFKYFESEKDCNTYLLKDSKFNARDFYPDKTEIPSEFNAIFV